MPLALDEGLLRRVVDVALDASAAIMEVYATPFEVEQKADDSPLTQADLAAHRTIVAGLSRIDEAVPILSEESGAIDYEVRRQWREYWLVDPLDGTKEFVSRNGEFTVNIALIRDHVPVFGVVWVPVKRIGYAGVEGLGAFRFDGPDTRTDIHTRACDRAALAVAGSRSHRDPSTKALIEKLAPRESISMGSSLKFCLVAEGRVDLYPRFGPTSEWDTAAAQCVVEQAGGRVTTVDRERLRYNSKADLLNPHFLVFGDPTFPWAEFLN